MDNILIPPKNKNKNKMRNETKTQFKVQTPTLRTDMQFPGCDPFAI